MRSVAAIATAILFTAAVTGSALAASTSSIQHHGQIQIDKKCTGPKCKVTKN